MRRKHILNNDNYKTLCGHQTTEQERRTMTTFVTRYVNCKRCLTQHDTGKGVGGRPRKDGPR
jgi:hypothetical protein